MTRKKSGSHQDEAGTKDKEPDIASFEWEPNMSLPPRVDFPLKMKQEHDDQPSLMAQRHSQENLRLIAKISEQ